MAAEPAKISLETSMGEIECELYWRHAPRTCKNFKELAQRGYYNNCKFHRVIKDFMIQTGDPTGTGRGGASIYGPAFEDEITRDLKHTGAGILSMANRKWLTVVQVLGCWMAALVIGFKKKYRGPHTNGSQFFITLAPTQWLDGKHTIFGRICGGIGVVNRIGLVETDPGDRPIHDVYILGGKEVQRKP